jgi:hypothetical protein
MQEPQTLLYDILLNAHVHVDNAYVRDGNGSIRCAVKLGQDALSSFTPLYTTETTQLHLC